MELPLQDPVIQFAVLVTAAFVVQFTVSRARLPGLIGLLILGVLLGPGAAGVLPQEPVVSLLGHIGLIYLMFMAGLEIDLGIVREQRAAVLAYGLLAFSCTLLPAAGVALLTGFPPAAAALLGSMISSHTLIAYPTLRRLQLLRRLPVVAAVGGTLLTDTLALLVLAIVLGLQGAGGSVAAGLLPVLLLGVLAALALRGVPPLARAIFRLPAPTRAQKALFAFAVLMILATAAELIGTDSILGGFLAGVSLNRVLAERPELKEHIEFAGGMLFVPFFFVWTGTLLEVGAVVGGSGVWAQAAVLFALLVAGKLGAAWIAGSWFGYSVRERLLITGLTLPQAAATLAVTITAHEAGLFPSELVDAVILLILVTCLIGPLLTDRIGRRLSQREGEHADRRALHEPAAERH